LLFSLGFSITTNVFVTISLLGFGMGYRTF
jgi:hypothetical protein